VKPPLIRRKAAWTLDWVLRLKQTGNWDWKMPRVLVSQRLSGGSSRQCFSTIREQPQMKK